MPYQKTPKSTPAVTTYMLNNHAVRSEKWRYIRYQLYDRVKDPNEWTNLAGKPELAGVKKELAQWLPKHNEPDAPGGRGKDEE